MWSDQAAIYINGLWLCVILPYAMFEWKQVKTGLYDNAENGYFE